MKKITFCLLAMIAGTALVAQLPSPFSAFPVEYVSSGYLLSGNGVFKSDINQGETFNPVSVAQARDVAFQLYQSQIEASILPSVDDLCEMDRQLRLSEQTISLRLINMFYHELHPDAVSNGWIAFEEGSAVDLSEGWVNPFEQKRAFQMLMDASSYSSGDLLFKVPADGIYSNTEEVIDFIEVDMDNGLGWQPIILGQTFEVQYNDDATDRQIRLRAMVNGTFLNTAITLTTAGLGAVPALSLPPWESDDPSWPWRISADAPFDNVRANAYTWSTDDVFDKPFVFVEGIDFGLQPSPQRNGDFGWAEFSTGGGVDYPFLYNTPALLDALAAEGFDVILLDFEDGARDLLENAQVLKTLIRLINTYKEGNEEMIVAGASMGGVVSRIALREMELEGENHCVRTWISLDAPHAGANIPLSIQHALYFLKDHFQEASWFYHNQLLRPASRQLLLQQVPQMIPLSGGFYEYLGQIGYPEFVRKVGIANGSGNAVGMEFNNGQPLVDYECEILGTSAAKFLFLSSPGDPFHELSTPFGNVLSQTFFSESTACSGLDCFFDPPFILDVWESTTIIPSTTVGLDNVPGGFRNTVFPLIESLNEKLEERLSIYNISPCPTAIENYIPHHAFIPTISALGLDTDNYFEDAFDLLDDYPMATPFDRVYAPAGFNMQHSEINNAILSLVLEEVLETAFALPPVLNESEGNDGQYNLALPKNHILPEITVENGGNLFINAFLPVEGGEDPLLLPEFGSDLRVRSACGALIAIGDQGSIQVGDVNGYTSAQLTLLDGSILDLFEGGTLRVQQGSELVLRSGAELHLRGGSLLLEGDCRIRIEQGAKLVVHDGTPIELSGIESRIDIYGKIHVDDEVECTVMAAGAEGGKLRFFEHQQNLIGNASSTFRVVGSGANDKMIEVATGGAFWTSPSFGKVEASQCLVEVKEDAKFTVGGTLRMNNVKLSGETDNMGLRCYGSTRIKHSVIDQMDILAFPGQNLFRLEESVVQSALLEVQSGGYRLEHCTLENAALRSEGLFYNGKVEECTFLNGVDYAEALFDDSDVSCFVEGSSFEDYAVGISKSGGELRLRCNNFEYCDVGVLGAIYTHINMSALTGAGYNRFSQNDVHLSGYGLSSISIYKGYNQFLQYNQVMMQGSIFGSCDDECEALLNGSGNSWFYQVPTAWDIQLQIIDPICDLQSPLELLDGCEVKVFDKDPQGVVACGAKDPTGEKPMSALTKSIVPDILVNSEHFSNVPLSEAVSFSIWKHSDYTENGDNQEAIDLLHEILTSDYPGIDLEVFRALAITEQVFRSFILQQAAEGEYVFEEGDAFFPPSLYLGFNALNKLTPNIINEVTYHYGFPLEVAKSQLLYAHCLHDEALELLDYADNCSVDTHEQGVLNHRFQRVYDQLQFEGMIVNQFDTDSLLADPTELPLPAPSPGILADANFGAIILSPDEVFYPECGNILPRIQSDRIKCKVYPNPASNRFMLELIDGDHPRQVVLTSAVGEEVLSQTIPGEQTRFGIQVDRYAPGWYQLQVWENGNRIFYEGIVIVR